MVAVLFGLIVFGVYMLMTRVVPQPTGTVALFSVVAVQQVWMGIVLMRRTPLTYAVVGRFLLALGGVVVTSASLRGHTLPYLPWGWAIPACGLWLSGALLMGSESRAHPRAWAAWKEHMRTSSILDILRMRHIPQISR